MLFLPDDNSTDLAAALVSSQYHNANPVNYVESNAGIALAKYKRSRFFRGKNVDVFLEFYQQILGTETGTKSRNKTILAGAPIESPQMLFQNE